MTKESIDTSNKAFKKANKARKRVMIAKDIINWLKEGKLEAREGNQIVVGNNYLKNVIPNDSTSFQETIKTLPVCTVCAKGAILLCTVARRNQVTNSNMPNNRNPEWTGDKLSPLLGNIFSPDQLRLIETEFEEWDYECSIFNDRRITPIMALKRKADEDRMIIIMENIIRNKGTFIPVAA